MNANRVTLVTLSVKAAGGALDVVEFCDFDLESVCLEGTVVGEVGRGNQEELLERNLCQTTFYYVCNNLILDV